MIHKETFAQGSIDGVPYHVCVQYYHNGELHASYFKNWNDAVEFEHEIDAYNRKT